MEVMVTDEGGGGVEDVDRSGISVEGKDVSVDGTGEVTVTMVEVMSDKDEKEVKAEGV